MKRSMSIIAVLVGAAFIGALSAQESPDYATQLQPIFDANCTTCHGWLTNYDNVMARVSSNELTEGVSAVVPGDAAESLLVWRLEGYMPDGTEIGRMPKDADPLEADQIQLIKDWINAGALAEAPTAVESRSWGEIKANLRAR